ncbi:MAG: ATP synthase subunit C [Pseudomonadota bacterium]|nr:ATP synthase subunit C [Pseudomonadota bacterium]
MKRQILLVALLVLGVALLAGASSLLLWHPQAFAEEVVEVAVKDIDPGVLRWGYMAAALATAVSALAAGYAVAAVGAAAVGALAEKPELFGRVVILVGLAEGIAIYGVIVSVLILNKLGI